MADTQQITKEFIVSDPNELLQIVGAQDEYITIIEEGLGVSINVFGNSLRVTGQNDSVEIAIHVLENTLALIQKGISVNSSDFISAINMAQNGTLDYFQDLYNQVLIKDAKGKAVRVKTFGQRQYVQAIQHHDVAFGIGPAGTGKTYLAVVMAVAALKKGTVDRIVLTRPAVEAGESLGFLPGDLKEKVDPYLRPIYDALHSILGAEHTERLMDRGVIEIAPLAYMRGRTLDNAFVILDEAQNTTNMQMKMFLTRLGFGSKMIVNGDISQIDLPKHATSGLVTAQKILQNIDQIEFVTFSAKDVVRHPVVAKIITAYEDNGQ
ncbi:MAG: PhoH family protein [Lentilactobacillus diolivorans]|uniref:PhoH-like protein n=2 Tax=Lentilactobacillus diolivorans TaxID=179838 RepID=A0A0R1SDD6_9LACO|nr:PhoH family protein [Lentilactobacillus diolivorans]KRL64261.1 PhoH family protein [Lentilactobacillus diolivorans DSM 14421]MDH5106029.1 PhoH family protein [Lentilactobacillus diolivorans]GEP22671.1 phosphate starvation protein PhoH [Lentilactobacillus diolivorans]